jgi:peptide/nickel transport system ATP-binding protein/oligopeptide transport system ATP-binding protein
LREEAKVLDLADQKMSDTEQTKFGDENLLEVKDLKTYFYTEDGVVPAVDGVSFSIKKGETLGIVGESGCGKSVTALSIMRLIQTPPGKIISGQILLNGEDLLKKTEKEMNDIRGNWISMVFQEPMTSLNPVYTVGDQIMEAILLHQNVKKIEARKRTLEMLKMVGIPSPESRINDYPHQMSGGMRQRVMIAIGLACQPKMLIADEPTTALDVTIQAQILDLMKRLKDELGTVIMVITHDLGVVAQMVDKVVVMYAGKVVESTKTAELFANPLHPYTVGLLGSIPKVNEDRKRLQTIEGVVPNLLELPVGCRFRPRCSKKMEICGQEGPHLVEVKPDHWVRCWCFAERARGETDEGK